MCNIVIVGNVGLLQTSKIYVHAMIDNLRNLSPTDKPRKIHTSFIHYVTITSATSLPSFKSALKNVDLSSFLKGSVFT